MGRGILIICVGMVAIIGIVQMSMVNRQMAMTQANSEYVLNVQSFNHAKSGLDFALNRLMNNREWRTEDDSYWVRRVDGHDVIITVTDHTTSQVRITSQAQLGDMPQRIEAIVQLGSDSGLLPPIFGAMGIYSDNLEFNVSGSAFEINGYDHLPTGELADSDDVKHGIAANNEDAVDLILDETNSTQQNQILGEGGAPSIESFDPEIMSGSELQSYVDRFEAVAHEVHSGEYTASGEGSLGTRENPRIIVVDGKLEVSNATGAGILIIKEGGELDVRGNLDHYEGLIIVQGKASMTRGNIHLYGSMLFGGENPEIEIDIDMRGNVNLKYSSDALNNASNRLANLISEGIVVLRIFE